MKSQIRILIAENIPSYNRGEAAILNGIVKSLKNVCNDIYISILSNNVDNDFYWYSNLVQVIAWNYTKKTKLILIVKLILCGLLSRFSIKLSSFIFSDKLWYEFLYSDIIFIGHDDSLAGKNVSPWLICCLIFSKFTNKKILISAGSITSSNILKKLSLKFLLNNVDLIMVRDPLSYNYCQSLINQNQPIFLTGDMAVLVDPISKDAAIKLLENEGIPLTIPIIGVTILRSSTVFDHIFELIPINNNGSKNEKANEHIEIIAQTFDYIIDHIKISLVFVPHCTGYGLLDDRNVAAQIQSRMRNKKLTYILKKEFSVSELKGIIGLFDIFIGERTHSVINALSMDIPSLALSFPQDYRTYGIIGELFDQKQCLYDIRYLNSLTLANAIIKLWNNKSKIKTDLPIINKQVTLQAKKFGEFTLGMMDQ